MGSHASFRLSGDNLDPDELTRVTGLTPDIARQRGEAVPFAGRMRVQTTGVWSVSSEHLLTSTSLERHLLVLLDIVEPHAGAIADVSDRQGLDADFPCYWATETGLGGPVLSASVLARIAALDAELALDFYVWI